MRKYHFLIALSVVLLDRLSKWLVATKITLHDSISIIPGFFALTHLQNSAAAFDLFAESSSRWKISVLIVFSLIAVAVISTWLWKNSHLTKTTGIGLSFILGGAVGNLWDRLLRGYVVDFLDVFVGNHHWPAFNVADSAIVVGALLLLAEILFAKTPAGQKVISNQ